MRRSIILILRALVAATGVFVSACASLLGIDKTYTEASDAAGGFCETLDAAAVVFCDDFDDGGALGASWSKTQVSAGNLLYLDDQGSVSPPSSVAMALASTALPYANLTVDLGVESSQFVTLEADVRLDGFSDASTSFVSALTITAVESDGTWNAGFFVSPSVLYLSDEHWKTDGGVDSNHGAAGNSFAVGKWTHVSLRVDLTTRTMSVSFDGALGAKQAIMVGWPTSFSPRIVVGAVEYLGALAQSAMHFDNVVVGAQ